MFPHGYARFRIPAKRSSSLILWDRRAVYMESQKAYSASIRLSALSVVFSGCLPAWSRGLSYEDPLRRLNPFTFERRLLRGDLNLAYTLSQGRLNVPLDDIFEALAERDPRRHDFQLRHRRFRLARRKAAFAVRLPKHRNKLPLEVVVAPSVKAFQRLLGSNWASIFPQLL